MNNGGYHSIRMTQKGFFGEPLVGVGIDSGDLSFPDAEKIAYVYNVPFIRCEKAAEMTECIQKALETKGPVLCRHL